MPRSSLPVLAAAVLAALPPQQFRSPTLGSAADTVQAGDSILDPSRLRPFELVRELTLSQGDTVRPFGRQIERLTLDTLAGRPVLLDVLIFDTPRALTVDSSWIDAATLRPIRMQSSNRMRVVRLEFEGDRVRGSTTPAGGAPEAIEHRLGVRPFEWNMFGLAISALPLRPGYRAVMPVFVAPYDRVVWYTVEVVGDTTLTRESGFQAPMWELVATGDSAATSARLWVSQRHRLVDRALLSDPGISILYARR